MLLIFWKQNSLRFNGEHKTDSCKIRLSKLLIFLKQFGLFLFYLTTIRLSYYTFIEKIIILDRISFFALQLIAKFKQRELMMIEQILQSKQHEINKQKYSQNDQQNPLGKYKLIINGYHKQEPFLTLGPNYAVFLFFFLGVNVWTIYTLFLLEKIEEARPFFLILTVTIIFLDVAWLATALINPGISIPNSSQEGQFCELCEANNDIEVKQITGRYHCPECDICIDDHESHLKLVGGCVGKNNVIAFKIFLGGVFLWGLSMITIVPLTNNW